MKPINITTDVITVAGPLKEIPLNIENIQQQISFLINPQSGFAGTYTVEANLGMIDKDIANDYNTTWGQTIVDPDGWFPLTSSLPISGLSIMGTGKLINYMPFAFIRINVVSLDSDGQIKITILEQSIR